VGTGNFGTLGTQNPTGGLLEAGRVGLPAATGAGGDGQTVLLKYSDDNDQPIKLRGTSDFVVINFNGVTVPSGGVIDFVIETYEDNS
jgi:uncharacterized protein YjdB